MTVNQMRALIQRRFIHQPWGYLLDCAKPDGSAVIPTPEECQKGIPNVFGWGVSNENGSFFTGLYLYALCRLYDKDPSEELKTEIRGLANGLFLLCDVCMNDGCVARGVADDGKSHYPFSSEDQAGPFILGLWRLSVSQAVDEAWKSEIRQRLVRVISGIRKAGWKVPTEWDGITGGVYCNEDWRGVSKLLFCAKVGVQLGILTEEEFEALRNEHPNQSPYSRFEIASHGFSPDMIRDTALIQFWIDVCANLCLYEMRELDCGYETYYRLGLESNGYAVMPFLNDYRKYDNTLSPDYNYDWRMLTPYAKEWDDPAQASRDALTMLGIYINHNPRWITEHRVVGNMLFGTWIALTSSDETTQNYARKKLEEANGWIQWETYCLSYTFVAVGAYSMLSPEQMPT